jgi:hypothetical protein
MAFCNNCGTQVPDGATACPNCGAAIGAPAPAPQPQPQMQPVPPQMQPIPPMQPQVPLVPLPKSKLGVSIGLFGAALYFIGLLGIIPVVLLAGYALLFEENVWLKKTAVKAVAVVVFFSIISAFIGFASNATSVLYDLVALFNGTIRLSELNRIIAICWTVLSFVQTLFLLMLGFKALRQESVSFGPIDRIIDLHL